MIFVDTTMWVSGIDASDKLHKDGKAVMDAIAERRLPPAVTTDFVLDETLSLLKRRHARTALITRAMNNILASSSVSVIYVDEVLFNESLSTFEKYEELSFTDSVTLTIMLQNRIREIYSHDSDFDLKGIIRKESA